MRRSEAQGSEAAQPPGRSCRESVAPRQKPGKSPQARASSRRPRSWAPAENSPHPAEGGEVWGEYVTPALSPATARPPRGPAGPGQTDRRPASAASGVRASRSVGEGNARQRRSVQEGALSPRPAQDRGGREHPTSLEEFQKQGNSCAPINGFPFQKERKTFKKEEPLQSGEKSPV